MKGQLNCKPKPKDYKYEEYVNQQECDHTANCNCIICCPKKDDCKPKDCKYEEYEYQQECDHTANCNCIILGPIRTSTPSFVFKYTRPSKS